MRQLTDVVKHLIIINVIVWFAVQALGNILPDLWLFFPGSEQFRPYQIITHMFDHDHGSLMHLGFNMMTLFFLGPAVERELGHKNFFWLYMISGLGATALSFTADYISLSQIAGLIELPMLDEIKAKGYELFTTGRTYSDPIFAKANEIYNTPSLGASGAIYGVVVAFAMFYPNNKLQMMFIPISIPAKYFVLIFIGLDLFLGLGKFKTGIGHFAHIGGALTGFLLVYFIFNRKFNRYN